MGGPGGISDKPGVDFLLQHLRRLFPGEKLTDRLKK